MTNPASLGALAERWRPLSDLSSQESVNAEVLLDDGWRLLRRKVARLLAESGSTAETLEELMVGDDDLIAEVVRVICTAVLRVLKNPDGKRQESIDDYSWTRDQAVSAGLLYFTDDELGDLIPGVAAVGRAFSIDPFAGRDWSDWS